jgi:phospholipid/cholesterol/gamma-HCH transport system substrate-binding protein
MREPSKGFGRELQVGLFVLAAALVVVAFSFRITDTPIFHKGTTLVAYFDDATGLFKNSKVKMAGIDIGNVKSIDLEQGRAKITLLINSGVQIPKGAMVVPRPLGILGDKYIEVVLPDEQNDDDEPGHPLQAVPDSSPSSGLYEFFVPSVHAQTSAPRAPNYREGQVIPSKEAPATLDDLTRQMGQVSMDLKTISSTLRKIVEGKDVPNSPISRTLRNAEALTANLNGTVTDNRKDFRTLVSTLARLSTKLERSFDAFDESQLRKDIKRLADSAGNLNKSLENVEKITSRIERGEGTLGKLVNDPSTADELNRTLRSVNTLVNRAQRTQVLVDVNTQYAFDSNQNKTYVSLLLMPREDAGYLGAVVVDPAGREERTETAVSTGGGAPVTTTTVTHHRTDFLFSLQYLKRIYNLGFRIGVFESTGGVAADAYLFKDNLILSTEIFDVTREGYKARLKSYALLRFLNYFYVVGGADDYLNPIARKGSLDPGRSFFAGIGIRFSDDDLKTILMIPGV